MMTGNAPTPPEAMPLHQRRALLAAAYGHGQAIAQLAIIGQSDDALAAYVAQHPDISEVRVDTGSRLTFAEVVDWQITLDHGGRILGYSQSGYGPLMERLGIDFSGAPYRPGN